MAAAPDRVEPGLGFGFPRFDGKSTPLSALGIDNAVPIFDFGPSLIAPAFLELMTMPLIGRGRSIVPPPKMVAPWQAPAFDEEAAAELREEEARTLAEVDKLVDLLWHWEREIVFHIDGREIARTKIRLFDDEAAPADAAPVTYHPREFVNAPVDAATLAYWDQKNNEFAARAEMRRSAAAKSGMQAGVTLASAPAAEPRSFAPQPPVVASTAPPSAANPERRGTGESQEAWQHRLFDDFAAAQALLKRDPEAGFAQLQRIKAAIEEDPDLLRNTNAYAQSIDPDFYADPAGWVARHGLPPSILQEIPPEQATIPYPEDQDPIDAFVQDNGNAFAKIAANGKIYDISAIITSPGGHALLRPAPILAALDAHLTAAIRQREAGAGGFDALLANALDLAPAFGNVDRVIAGHFATPGPKAKAAEPLVQNRAETKPEPKPKAEEASPPPEPEPPQPVPPPEPLPPEEGRQPAQNRPPEPTSGLRVVPRRGMTSRIVLDRNGRPVTIYGQAERSSSTTDGHVEAMNELAEQLAESGEYEYITLQRSLRTATGRVGTSRNIPDVIGVRRTGAVDQFEVRSKTDNRDELMQRLEDNRATLPEERRGEIDVLEPKSTTPEQD